MSFCTWSIQRLLMFWRHKAQTSAAMSSGHDDVIKWKHFPRYWPFVRRIYRSPVDSPQKDQWRRAFIFSLVCAWTNGGANTSRRRWFETPSRSLWRHRNVIDLVVPECPSSSTNQCGFKRYGPYKLTSKGDSHDLSTYPLVTSSVTGGFSLQRASNSRLWCLLWCLPEQNV